MSTTGTLKEKWNWLRGFQSSYHKLKGPLSHINYAMSMLFKNTIWSEWDLVVALDHLSEKQIEMWDAGSHNFAQLLWFPALHNLLGHSGYCLLLGVVLGCS